MAFSKLGKTPRGALDPEDFAFYGFGGGLNVKSAPQLLRDDELTIGYNVYLRPDGAVQLRNGMNAYGNAIAGTNQLILARFYQDVRNGSVVTPETVALLGQFGNNLYSIPSSGSPTLIGAIYNGS